MSLNLVRAVAKAEQSDDYHAARILLLVREADKRKATNVNGITKLAKMDFLLRYPTCLERALLALDKDPARAKVKSHERTTIESKMVRFRYGPWDDRYRRWIGLLVAQGLAVTFLKGRTVYVGLTDEGRRVANDLAESKTFKDIAHRSDEVYKAVGSWGGTRLMEFVYRTFPELETMKWGDKIDFQTK